MNKAHVKLHMGGAPAALEAYRGAPTPNVIVIEATHDRDALVGHLDELSQFCDAGTKVIVCGKVNDIILYRQLILRGVSEYLVAPFGVMEFVQAVSHLYSAPGANPVGRVVAVIGAKGGVGSSTIAHNIAWSIATGLEIATIIADLDLGFGTAGLDFNQDPPQGIAEAVFAPDRVDANLVDRLLSKCSDNLNLLAAPATLDRLYDFAETAFDSIIDVLRASTPCIVLDMPHGWTAWTRRMLVGADEVLIVAAPGSRQSAQHQEHARQYPQRASQRPSAEARAEQRRPAEAAGDCRRRFRQDDRDRADRDDPARRQTVRRGRQQRPDDR